MIRALIVDDEPLARRGIRQLLTPHLDVGVVGECRNGKEALRTLRSGGIDLVFLDVQMPGMDGLEVIRSLHLARPPVVVFITAHDQFAVAAFEAAAVDYLVKPIASARFDEALRRVRERLQREDPVELRRRLMALVGGDERIVVPTATGDLWIDVDEVEWIEADDYYVAIHARGTTFRRRDSLNALEQRLDPGAFFRLHRTALVRIAAIRELRTVGAGAEALLEDGTRLPVGRRRVAELRARMRGIAPS